MTALFNKNYASGNASTISLIGFRLMIITMAIIAAYGYGYALCLYTGVLYLPQDSISPLSPMQQFASGGHISMAALFALIGLLRAETSGHWTFKTFSYLLLTAVMFALFFWTLLTAG